MFGFGKRQPSQTGEPGDDLLAQSEAEAFDASVRAARARATAPSATPPKDVVPLEVEEDIEWAEQADVYRPRRIDSTEYLRATVPGAPARLLAANPIALIRASAMDRMVEHLGADLKHELGGLLVGEALYDSALDRFVILIEVAMAAIDGDATATSFTYTSKAWESILPGLLNMKASWTIVGSYHSHPGLGVFLSSVDLDTQVEVFPHDWQAAIVIDPVANACGVFAGASGKPCEFTVF